MLTMLRKAARLFILAVLLLSIKAPQLAAQEIQKAASPSLTEERINEILIALAKFDSRFKVISAPDFSIDSGDLKITVKAHKPVFYNGDPVQKSTPLTGLYGQVDASAKLYGVEVILHYLLLKENAPYGGAMLQERVTVLYEETSRFKPVHPRIFDSKPFTVNKDGTFIDRQLFGRFRVPFPDSTTQILKQELILDSELIATIYIVRTPKEIRVVGYSVPPLISDLVLP